MFKSFKIIKNYYRLTGIKLGSVFLEFIFLLVPSVLSIISTVLAANIISSITVYDFSLAIYYLSLDFAFIIISAISYLLYHLVSRKVCKIIAININEYIYNNLKQNTSINKVNLSALQGINNCMEFNKNLLYKLCFFIKSIVILSIILYYNLIIGFIIFCVSLISYLLLSITDKKIQTNNKEYTKFQASSLELFNSIQKGIREDNNQDVEDRLKAKYFARVAEGSKIKNKISMLYGINNNFITMILKCAVFGLTIYLILLVKSTTLTLSLYLILTPYLTSSAQNLISFFELFSEIGLVDNTLSEFESLKFKAEPLTLPEKEFEIDNFNLYFYHTTFKNNDLKNKSITYKNFKTKNKRQNLSISLENSYETLETENMPQDDFLKERVFEDEKNIPPVYDLNLKINFGEVASFIGGKNDGGKAIYKLLSREISTTEGSIFLDHKNIAEIDARKYRQLVSFSSTTPHFFNISILENLLLVCESKQKIINELKATGLKSDIDFLPERLNTIIDEKFNKKLLYFLGIFRSYISGAKIINIFGVPDDLTGGETKRLLHLIKHIKGKCTIIIFNNSDTLYEISDTTHYLKNSKIKSTISLSPTQKKANKNQTD